MKVIKGLILFCFLGISISSCFDPPEFNVVPEITFNKIQFKEKPAIGQNDTLILYIDFKDGDGDLGLDDNFLEEPFNDSYYFLEDSTGATFPVVTEFNGAFIELKKESGVSGKLVTDRTRVEPNYNYLPVYDPNSCLNYQFTEMLVRKDHNVVDATYNIVDETTINNVNYYIIEEALLFERNVFHNNIDVKFWVFENGSYVEFDWFEEFCNDFNGRFPIIPNKNEPIEGTLRYYMPSSNFLGLFSVKTLKLSIVIRDRALHTSNEVLTPPFTLDAIKVN